MNKLLFLRLAANGIKKNRKLYIPYILSFIGTVMMFYIIHSLSYSPLLSKMSGGSSIEQVLGLGKFVIAVFSALFLFYTNSFLTKRRNKEFGLYNILGMDKKGIAKIIFFESVIISLIGLVLGLVFGIAFSKLAELGLINAIGGEIDYKITVASEGIIFTVEIYAIIFLILLIKSLLQVKRLKPLQLLHSESTGEKPPKANWLFAVIGVILLGTAYGISVSIKSPLAALVSFFIAVIMVIVATYLLFISGSVALCKLLQKNKKYYYKKNHFVSVSSMAFRMKRNGAGLASICILATMVLVMFSSTTSLYFGAEDSLKARFPMDSEIQVMFNTVDEMNEENTETIIKHYEEVFNENNFVPSKKLSYNYCEISGLLKDNILKVEIDDNQFIVDFNKTRNVYFVSLSEYNKLSNKNLTLKENEIYIKPYRCKYSQKDIIIGDLKLMVKGKIEDFTQIGNASTTVNPSLFVVVKDFSVLKPLDIYKYKESETTLLTHYFYYGYNANVSDEKLSDIFNKLRNSVDNITLQDGINGYSAGCIALERADFITTYGGMFFLGIILSGLFIFAAAMIIYYKQVSEGFEDKSRFEIMQKVGMTKKDIKKSINSQILTVFFAPLIFAGLHLAFAFPLIWKLLMLFNLRNMWFVVMIDVISFVIFAIIYAVIYKLTARAYYTIVADSDD